MSYTEIYKFTPKGNVKFVAEIKNAYRGAAAVWDIIGNRYLGNYIPEWSKSAPADMKRESYSRMMDKEEMRKVWALYKSKDISEVDKIVLLSTFDYAVCMFKDLPRLIKAFNEFQGETSLPEQAQVLQGLLKSKTVLAVAWNQSSVGEFLLGEKYNLLAGTQHFDFLKDL